jgi:cell division protein FtsB
VENLSRKFWPYILLIILVALLQVKFFFGQGNWRQVQELRAQVLAQKKENEVLLNRNRALAAEVKDLKSGVDAIEERARNEMGMIKSGETFYRVVDTEKKQNMPSVETEQKP